MYTVDLDPETVPSTSSRSGVDLTSPSMLIFMRKSRTVAGLEAGLSRHASVERVGLLFPFGFESVENSLTSGGALRVAGCGRGHEVVDALAGFAHRYRIQNVEAALHKRG